MRTLKNVFKTLLLNKHILQVVSLLLIPFFGILRFLHSFVRAASFSVPGIGG